MILSEQSDERLSAYQLIKEEELKDISSKGYLFKHKKSGARIAVISNDDENKVFSIGFRTTPEDETGVPHIIEHTTLCGSEKYPIKDPFVDLVKGSLNTFLNAMTYPDKTMYPIASYNDQDYKNLMDVYLDAVFSPMLLKEEKIFKQEGWHYEMEDADGDLTINGVVYNEMKGAYSSADEILMSRIMSSLYPDNTYGQDSGGNPEKIPELTYEKYLEFYHTYYHPSNSYIYLYGDVDIAERLDYLDREYLSKYSVLEMHTEIVPQKPFERQARCVAEYPVAQEESTENATYLSYNWVVGDALDDLGYLTVDILDYALISAPGAPIMKALLEAGICEDVYSVYESGIRQRMFSIVAKGANAADEERFKTIIEDTLRGQVKNGLNKNSLLAAINSNEFRFREADFGRFPKGLMYGLQAMDSWLFDDEEPFLHILCLDNYAKLKRAIDTDYFERQIEQIFLNNPHSSVVVLEPNPGLNGRVEAALKERLQRIRSGLTADEIQAIVDETEALHKYQDAPTDEADKECLPMLRRADLNPVSMPFSNIVEKKDGITIVRHDYDTSGIDYITLYFDVSDMNSDQFSELSLLTGLLGMMDTEHYSYLELSNAVNIYTGGIAVTATPVPVEGKDEQIKLLFMVRMKTMEENLEKTLSLVDEVLYTTKLNDPKRLLECIVQIKSRMESELSSNGHMTASNRAMSGFSKNVYVLEAMHGVDYYRYICKTEKLVRENPDAVVSGLKTLLERIISKNRLTVGITSDEAVYQRAIVPLLTHLSKLPEDSTRMEGRWDALLPKKEGLTDASQVQYVCRAGNFKKHGFAYSGCLRILKLILSYDYLWLNVRVKGGAYGCMSNFYRGGEAYFVSYRDPNLEKTNRIFEGVADYLRNFNPDDREMTGYVIGTFGAMDTPMNPEAKGHRSMNAYFTGITYDQLQSERTEILNATAEDIRNLAPLVDSVIEDGYFCVVGNENAIEQEKSLFTSIEKLCE